MLLILLICSTAVAVAADDVSLRLQLDAGSVTDAELVAFTGEDVAWLRGRRASAAPPATTAEQLGEWLDGAGRRSGRRSARTVLSHLRDRWLERGYAAVELFATEPDSGATTITIVPGARFRWGEIDVAGADFPRREHLLEVSLPQPGDEFAPAGLDRAAHGLLGALGEMGYPFARWLITGAVVDSANSRVAVEVALYPGREAFWGSFSSDLEAGRGEDFLFRAAGLRIGERFRESELGRAARRLRLRGLYESVEEPIVYREAAPDTIGLHWAIKPLRRSNRISVILGLSRRETDDKARLSGEIDLSLPNLAGTGRRLRARWQDDGSERSLLSFAFGEPLAFGTPLDLDLSVANEVSGDAYTLFRAEATAQMPVVAAWGVEVGVGWDRGTFPTGDIERSVRVRTRVALSHRRIDLRRSGWSALLGIEAARRSSFARSAEDAGTAGTGAFADRSQTLLLSDLAAEVYIASAWSVAGRVSWRDHQSDEESVPLVEQYRFGGAASLRGYREDEFHGSTVAWGGLELRVGRPGGSRLYTFWDVGYFRFQTAPTGVEEEAALRRDIVRGFGLGLWTRGAGGDISLSVGFPGEVDFDRAKLHVTLIEAF